MKIVNNFLTTYRYTIAFSCCMILLCSCTKDFDEINRDKNGIASIGATEIPFLFSQAQAVAPGSTWDYQGAYNLFADLYVQYFATTEPSFPSDRLVIKSNWVIAAFNPIYVAVLPQLQTIFTSASPTSAEYALASIWWVYAFHRVTDYWGPIPYFSAGIPGNSVAYDPQDKIYDDFFKRLDNAVAILKTKTTETPFGNFDLVYGGSVPKWIKYANSLRLRLALRISKVDPARAKTEAEAAYAGGVMTSSADDAFVIRTLIDRNGLSVMTSWDEFRMSAAMESVLKGYQDPRTSQYFIPAVNTGTYEGLRNGLTAAERNLPVNSPRELSHIGPRWARPADGGIGSYLTTSSIIMGAAESYFLRAEGAMLGWNMGGTAKELYEAGITTSMNQWGITDNTVIQNYINSTLTPVATNDYLNSPAMTNIPVKFSIVQNEQKEQIAIQKWLAIYPDGVEAWADYRRSHTLKLYPIAESDNPDITNTATQWIRRIPFLDNEKLVNGAEVTKAVQLLGGDDKITTPLWWDKN